VSASGNFGESDSGVMFIKLKQLFDDVFEHLGVEVTYVEKNTNGIPGEVAKQYRMCCKHPENVYEVGSSQVIGQVAEFSAKASDVTPKVGAFIFLGSKKYKIHEEPLLDASNLVWKFSAVLMEK
jgi:hypothetical protein